jgi:hypothetical protein
MNNVLFFSSSILDRFSSGDLSSECDDVDPNELPPAARPAGQAGPAGPAGPAGQPAPLQQQPMPGGPPNIPPPPGLFSKKLIIQLMYLEQD